MRFFGFVEKHDGIRLAPHLLDELTLITVADVTGRGADEPRYAVLFAVFRHVESYQRVFASVEVLGKAFGAAYTIMGSKSIGADIAFACENAKISAMPTKSAVAFAWNDKVKDNAKRAEVEAQWDAVMASPVAAAKAGEIDDIISLDELRQRASSAFEMLGAKNALCTCKRHNNLPLYLRRK